MATILHGVSESTDSGLLVTLRQAASAFRSGRAARRSRLAIMRELAQLDARDLHDLAISRYDFTAISNGSFRR